MPNEPEHIQLAIHNIGVIDYLLAKPEFCDWTATVTFYTALHIVEAVFFYDKKNSNKKHGYNHETRERILKGIRSYQNIWKHYRPIQSASTKSRYLKDLSAAGVTFQQHMPHQIVKDKLIKHHLAQLIKTAKKFLSLSSGALLDKTFKQIS
ncbi:MAG: hypothetical protein KAI59_06840 [Planctomycetes bacterium]|nr:hypothetical protein [Planctomycetota bacterium]MCK5473734.1 hypothetical protein [Planctomycetota bacterium]